MELRPVVDPAPGQHLREERGSRRPTRWGLPRAGGAWVLRLRGCPASGTSPQSPAVVTHQRDLGPRARRGAVEGRARGGRWFVGQEGPQAGERRECGGRRQPGSHQGPDSCHGRAGQQGQKVTQRKNLALTEPLAPAQSPRSRPTPASAGGRGGACAVAGRCSPEPAWPGWSGLSGRAASGAALPLARALAPAGSGSRRSVPRTAAGGRWPSHCAETESGK